ncbi:uncharacterized protein LOC119283578 [Triticum dicoccoides]|uniref:uncharacterized protein LOC119283578 n=1 Tax=Triticum dicoccoides TaxID=85692 RepID=UPI0018904EE3|nr:uncharacterized protein LOC119283578 [Triticum dicoccoides]
MSSIIVPVCINAPELSTILENNAGLEYLTKTRKVCVRRLLSANAHGYPIPPPVLEYTKRYHKAYFTDEAQAQLKAAGPYVPGSTPTNENNDQSHDNGEPRKNCKGLTENPTLRDQVQTYGASSSVQQRIAKRPKLDIEEIYRTRHPELYQGFITDAGIRVTEDSPIPEECQTEEFLEAMEILEEINGAPCYDAESLALGSLKKAEYFLMPDTIQFEPCAVDSICRGSAFWKPDRKLLSQVYALAKVQALQLGKLSGRFYELRHFLLAGTMDRNIQGFVRLRRTQLRFMIRK